LAIQNEIENQGGQCLFIECDVSKADSVKKMAQEQDPEQAMASWQPLSNMGMPQDVARAALYFASDDSEFATGSIFVIDGGLTSE